VYDCLYLSLALRLSCPLITADRRLGERGTELGLAVEAITAA
jgi:predicted nucleic acid-binding protein